MALKWRDNMKNIILCSDGTGNKGGSGDNSNVYKMFNAVDLRPTSISETPDQISYYDNGVGTQDNNIIRSLSAGLGIGFKNNVRGLYEFLARNYTHHEEPDKREKIYVFGFSRGAATARAFTGMVQWCGLLNKDNFKKNGLFDEKKFQQSIDKAMDYYETSAPPNCDPGKHDPHIDQSKSRKQWNSDMIHPHGNVKIHFLGIWDTVSALGFPKNFSPAWSIWIKYIFNHIEHFSNKFFPHRFYDYQPHLIVDHVYHALAIDDKRSTFHPIIWDERPNLAKDEPRPKTIEQVWFAGVHANVGGGYPRAGLSDVALDWMMVRAKNCGLRFNPGIKEEVYHRANVQGELYDSRKSLGIFYRYAPRDINALCRVNNSKPLVKPDSIKIHNTVIQRMTRTTDNYAPVFLPDQFQISDREITTDPLQKNSIIDKSQWVKLCEKIEGYILTQQQLYRGFIETVLLLTLLPIITPESRPCSKDCTVTSQSFMEYTNDILSNFVPEFLENLLYFSTVTHPWIFFSFLAYLVWWFILPKHTLDKRVQHASEQKRAIFLKAVNYTDKQKEDVISADQERETKEWEPSRFVHKISDYFVDKHSWAIQWLGSILSLVILIVIGYSLLPLFK
jgi:uncharacterized protein (DUF2235 family)